MTAMKDRPKNKMSLQQWKKYLIWRQVWRNNNEYYFRLSNTLLRISNRSWSQLKKSNNKNQNSIIIDWYSIRWLTMLYYYIIFIKSNSICTIFEDKILQFNKSNNIW